MPARQGKAIPGREDSGDRCLPTPVVQCCQTAGYLVGEGGETWDVSWRLNTRALNTRLSALGSALRQWGVAEGYGAKEGHSPSLVCAVEDGGLQEGNLEEPKEQ